MMCARHGTSHCVSPPLHVSLRWPVCSDRQRDGDLCYKELNWIEVWMNAPANKKALGVNPSLEFASCNMEVNQAFFAQGDGMHNTAALLPELINDDIKLLVYAGNADAMCNFIVRLCSPRFNVEGMCRWVAHAD